MYAATIARSNTPIGRRSPYGRPSSSIVVAGSRRNTAPLRKIIPKTNVAPTKLTACAISDVDKPHALQKR